MDTTPPRSPYPSPFTAPSPTIDSPRINQVLRHELHHLRKNWWCLFLLGIALTICGVTAVSYPMFFSAGVAIATGILLLIGGVATVVTSFWALKWNAFLIQMLSGIVYVVLGMAMAESPVASTAALTLLIAAFSVAGGMFRIIAALMLRFPQWGWVLMNGIVALLFGLIIFRHFPEASYWLIGTIVGIDLIFSGITWTMLSLEVKSLPVID